MTFPIHTAFVGVSLALWLVNPQVNTPGHRLQLTAAGAMMCHRG